MYSDNTILFTGNRRHKNLLENCKNQEIPVIHEIMYTKSFISSSEIVLDSRYGFLGCINLCVFKLLMVKKRILNIEILMFPPR